MLEARIQHHFFETADLLYQVAESLARPIAEAAQAVTRAVQSEVELVIINKFSKQEAGGQGLRSEFAEAIMAGRPLLTAVPQSCVEAWGDFIGDQSATLACTPEAVEAWWRGACGRN